MSKQSIVTLVLILLVTNYASFQAGQTLRYYKTAPGPNRTRTPVAGARSQGVNQVLAFTPSRVDFGRISGSDAQERLVEFENRGSEPIAIKQIKTSCECTIVEVVGASIIPPQEKGQLKIKVDPVLASTDLAVSVSVEYEGTPRIDRLLVSAQVLK